MNHVSSVGVRRQVGALILTIVGTALLVFLLTLARGTLNLASDVLAFVVLVVAVAMVGGLVPALAAAVVDFLALNYWFTQPLHTLTVSDPNNLVALVGFALVGAMVSWIVDLAARRSKAAAAAAELEAGNQLRTALLAAVGHDLRTPLAIAKAVVSGLRSPGLELSDADQRELLEAGDTALDRLNGLVENLLDMSRLQAGGLTVHLAAVPLEDIVARAIDDLRVSPRAVRIELPEELPPVIADAGLLERVVANLVANAQRHATAPTLVGALAGECVELRVVDHGPGIAPNERDRAFLPFQRLDDSSGSGLGLGLALCRGLIEAMAGTLRPEETPGGGLTMVVSLPAALP